MESSVFIKIFHSATEYHVATYTSAIVPRVGDKIWYNSVTYLVTDVLWTNPLPVDTSVTLSVSEVGD